ncbi:MAG: toll/interleukin-1 receptor domain-containing protein [Anaerolineales bacterium]
MAGIWWFLIGLAAGLLIGGGFVYLLTYRRLQKPLREWRVLRQPAESLLQRLETERRIAPGQKTLGLPERSPFVGRKMGGEEVLVGAADEEMHGMIVDRTMDFDEAPPPRRSRRAERRAEQPEAERLEEAEAAMEEKGREEAVASAPAADLVHFSVTAPPAVPAGSTFLLSVWAHLDAQRAEVLARARQELGEEPAVHTRGPARVARGTRLAFHVEVEGLTVEEPVGWVDWEGEVAQAAFFVNAPADAAAGNHKGRVSVYVEGMCILEMRFLIRVGEVAAESAPLTTEIHRCRSAFASYSSKDRAEVFKRIQGIHQVAPDLDIFVDVDSLRSGQDWERELWQQIGSRDVFFLFWSSNARKSRWVEKEWRFALEKRGVDFIDPVPLEPPDQAPPPPELSSKHFNDRELVFIKAYAGP